MAKLDYAPVIAQDSRYKNLADLGIRSADLDTHKLILRLLELVDDEHLPLLAESRSMLGDDGYHLAQNDIARRKLIKDAIFLHRRKGTPWAMREICRRLGLGEIEIIEGLGGQTYNGHIQHNGIYLYSDVNHGWAYYSIILGQPIKNSHAAMLKRTLPSFAPARCVLVRLDYQNTPLYYNNTVRYDGNYNHGAV